MKTFTGSGAAELGGSVGVRSTSGPRFSPCAWLGPSRAFSHWRDRMTKLERIAAVVAVAFFYLGSILIAFQAAPAWEASLMLDAYEEAEYQQGLAQGYREVIVRGSDATAASLAVCVDTREKLEAEIAVRRPPMDRMVEP